MPLQMQATGGGSTGGVIDLYSPYMQQQQQQQAQKQADWGGIMQAFQQLAQYKAQQDFLKQQGVIKQEPIMGTFNQQALNKGNLGQFSPEAQAQLRGMAQEKVNYPTGKTQPFFDQSKIPPGMKITIPGTGIEVMGQKQGIEAVPEGFEITGYNADGRPFVKKIKEEKIPDLTLSNALSIVSDPMKARQLKTTYPNLYKRAEQVIREQLGEDVLSKVSISIKPKIKSKSAEEDTMDTNW